MHTIDVTLTADGLVPGSSVTALERPYMSPSTMNALTGTCPASWAAQRLSPRLDDPMSAAGTGTIVHAVMEDLFNLPAHERTYARARALWASHQLKARERSQVDDEAWFDHFSHYDDAIRAVFDPAYVGQETPERVDVVGTEIALGSVSDPVVVAGVPVYGLVDRLQRDDDGALHMRDYKLRGLKDGTVAPMPDAAHLRRFGDDYGHQQRTYAMALEELGYGALAGARLLYLGSRQTRDIDLSEDAMDATRARLRAAWDANRTMADERLYPYQVGPLCRFCPLCEVCPAAAGRTSRAGKALDAPSSRRTAVPVRVSGGAPTTSGGMSNDMTWGEDKPWVSTTDEGPNASAYGAASVFGTTALAWEVLSASDLPITPANVSALARALAWVVLQSATAMLGRPARWGDGAVTRCSGALRAFMATRPVPLGDADALESWCAKAVRACTAMSGAALDLMTNPPTDEERPWQTFTKESK